MADMSKSGLTFDRKRWNIIHMKAELISIKTSPRALKLLRLIAAHTGEKQYEVLERVLQQELALAERITDDHPCPDPTIAPAQAY